MCVINKISLVLVVLFCMVFNNLYASDNELSPSNVMNALYNKCSENAVFSSKYLLGLKQKLTNDKTFTDESYKEIQYHISNRSCLLGITDALDDYKKNKYRLSYYRELKKDEGNSIFDKESKEHKNNDPSVMAIIPDELFLNQIVASQSSSIYGYELVGYAFGVLN